VAGRSKSDYFGTFLETLQQQDSKVGTDPNVPRLLGTLRDSGPRKIWELQEEMQISLPELTQALDFATQVGLVSVDGPYGKQEVALTQEGGELAAQLQV
jgi:hypothetical protein